MKRLVLLLVMIVGSSQAQALQSARRLARDSQPQPTGKGSISGNVLNEVTKEPIKRARVALSGLVGLVAVTDDSGHFAFKMLPSGQFSLMAQAPNFSIPRQ